MPMAGYTMHEKLSKYLFEKILLPGQEMDELKRLHTHQEIGKSNCEKLRKT